MAGGEGSKLLLQLICLYGITLCVIVLHHAALWNKPPQINAGRRRIDGEICQARLSGY